MRCAEEKLKVVENYTNVLNIFIKNYHAQKVFTFTMPFTTKGQYALKMITDGTDSRSFANEERNFKASETLKINMLGRGGFVARLIGRDQP